MSNKQKTNKHRMSMCMTRKEIRHHIYIHFPVHLTSIYLYKERKKNFLGSFQN
jgi:hypothetical protein